MEMRKCNICQETKPLLDDFSKDPGNAKGRSYRCKACAAAYAREYRKKHKERTKAASKKYYHEVRKPRNKEILEADPDLYRRSGLKYNYNVTLDQYNQMLSDQNHVCAICGGVSIKGRWLSVDHDHACCPGRRSCGKCVRSLLCHNCNSLLGYAKDDVEHLMKAIEYINRHREIKE